MTDPLRHCPANSEPGTTVVTAGVETDRIACYQFGPKVGDLDANHRQTTEAIHRAVKLESDVIVLPELATSGYVFHSREEAATVAISPEHQIFKDWAGATVDTNAVVIGGFCERGRDGLLYNSAAVVDKHGVLAVYRKAHLWDREKLVFAAGETPPPLVDVSVGRIGLCICYELAFPEITRAMALRGADLIVVPTNWPLLPRPERERPLAVTIAMGTARVNRVAIACCDRVGTERGQQWTGGTSIIDDTGWVKSSVETEGFAIADISIRHSRHKRLSPRNHVFDDRRPTLYEGLR